MIRGSSCKHPKGSDEWLSGQGKENRIKDSKGGGTEEAEVGKLWWDVRVFLECLLKQAVKLRAWGREGKAREPLRHMGLDTETEEALGAQYWLKHQRTSSLSFCQHSWLAANWVKRCLYRSPRELDRELGSALRAAWSESLAQPNCWAWGQAAVECHRYNKSLSTPWKKTQSPQLFSLLWPMAIKTPYQSWTTWGS